jgi:flavodoxin
MKNLIIYDSVFGNTEKVAQAIGEALSSQGQIVTLPVSRVTVDKLHGLDLLIVGSPTRSFRPTPAVAQFMKALPRNHLAGIQVAAFDTSIWLDTIDSSVFRFVVNKGGYAASTIANALKKKGGRLLAPPEGFLVTGNKDRSKRASWSVPQNGPDRFSWQNEVQKSRHNRRGESVCSPVRIYTRGRADTWIGPYDSPRNALFNTLGSSASSSACVCNCFTASQPAACSWGTM